MTTITLIIFSIVVIVIIATFLIGIIGFYMGNRCRYFLSIPILYILLFNFTTTFVPDPHPMLDSQDIRRFHVGYYQVLIFLPMRIINRETWVDGNDKLIQW